MATFEQGEEVDIVAGSYKKYKTATYIRPYGWRGVMVTVQVHGDKERNIYKSSIAKKKKKTSRTASYTNYPNYNTDTSKSKNTKKKTITIDEDEYYELQNQLASLTASFKKLESKFND